MRIGTTVLKKLFPVQDAKRVDLRMAAKCAAAHAEDLTRTVVKLVNGSGDLHVASNQDNPRKAR